MIDVVMGKVWENVGKVRGLPVVDGTGTVAAAGHSLWNC